MLILKNTQTEKNLFKALCLEFEDKIKYQAFSKQAEKEGNKAIYNIFIEAIKNEEEHFNILSSFLEKPNLNMKILPEIPLYETSLEYLNYSAEEESINGNELYPNFSEIAKKEGFSEIGFAFEIIGKVEKKHEMEFKKLYSMQKNGVFDGF